VRTAKLQFLQLTARNALTREKCSNSPGDIAGVGMGTLRSPATTKAPVAPPAAPSLDGWTPSKTLPRFLTDRVLSEPDCFSHQPPFLLAGRRCDSKADKTRPPTRPQVGVVRFRGTALGDRP
jgi:hypothetical protein